ncbi:MAG: VOC family protein [Paracoccaceae bacterium]
MLALDHIVVTAATLAEAVSHIEQALGVRLPEAIGRHDLMGTHNRLLGLGPDDYLEAIAPDPAAPPPKERRWFDLDHVAGPARLSNWVLRTDNLAACLGRLPGATGRQLDLSRGDFRWTMSAPESGFQAYGGAFPALLQWHGGLKPPDRLADAGCRLTGLEIAHPEAAEIAALLGLRDARIQLVPGRPACRARFATPHGERYLQ